MAQLLELLPFLDPRFKLAHVTDKDDIPKEIEKHMMMEISTEILTPTSSTVATGVSQVQSTANGSSDTFSVLSSAVSPSL